MIPVYSCIFNNDLEKALRTGYFEFQNPCQTGELHQWVDEAFDMLRPKGVIGRQKSAIMPLLTEGLAYEFSRLAGVAVLKAQLPPETLVREGAYQLMLIKKKRGGKDVRPEVLLPEGASLYEPVLKNSPAYIYEN